MGYETVWNAGLNKIGDQPKKIKLLELLKKTYEKALNTQKHLEAIFGAVALGDRPKIRYVPNGNVEYDRVSNTMTLDPNNTAEEIFSCLIFESGNAKYKKDYEDLEKRFSNSKTTTCVHDFGQDTISIEAKTVFLQGTIMEDLIKCKVLALNQFDLVSQNTYAEFRNAVTAAGVGIDGSGNLQINTKKYLDADINDVPQQTARATVRAVSANSVHNANAAPMGGQVISPQTLMSPDCYGYERVEKIADEGLKKLLGAWLTNDVHARKGEFINQAIAYWPANTFNNVNPRRPFALISIITEIAQVFGNGATPGHFGFTGAMVALAGNNQLGQGAFGFV